MSETTYNPRIPMGRTLIAHGTPNAAGSSRGTSAFPVALSGFLAGCRNVSRQATSRLAGWVYRCFGTRAREAFGVLMYHRVSPHYAAAPPPTWNVTPERFYHQLQGLLTQGFVAWPLRTALEYHRARRPLPRKVFVVTFDDGYESVYRNAWPVLKELNVPATVFLTTSFLDASAPFPCDDWGAENCHRVPAEAYRPLYTAQAAEMLAGGLVELAAHGHAHVDFLDRPASLYDDLRVSLAVLQDRFGLRDATFAFPYGRHSPTLSAAAKRAGVLCSLTTVSELVRPDTDPFDWGRFTAESEDTATMLAGKLSGWYNLARSAWQCLPKRRGGTLVPGGAA